MTTFEIVQTVIAIIGFSFVIYQLHQVERTLRSSTRWSIYDLGSQLKQVFIKEPELRPYFYNNKDITPDDSQYDQVMATADLFCLYLESIAAQKEGISAENTASWNRYLKSIYTNSPAIRAHLKKNSAWYTQEYVDTFSQFQ